MRLSMTETGGRLAGSGRARKWRLSLVTAAILALSSPAMAVKLTPRQQVDILAEAEALFDKAQAMRVKSTDAKREFLRAARKYQLLIDSGTVTGKLYYNLANAYLQAGRLGEAIANYKRAARLMGDNEQLRKNLRYARSLVKGPAPRPREASPSLSTALGRYLPLSRQVWLGVVVWLAFWLVMTARLFWPTKFRWRYPLLCLATVFVILAGSVAYELYRSARRTEGVVIAEVAEMLKGNGEGFARKFDKPITEGTEFDLIARRGDWLEISLADGKTGWIKASQAELIDSPLR